MHVCIHTHMHIWILQRDPREIEKMDQRVDKRACWQPELFTISLRPTSLKWQISLSTHRIQCPRTHCIMDKPSDRADDEINFTSASLSPPESGRRLSTRSSVRVNRLTDSVLRVSRRLTDSAGCVVLRVKDRWAVASKYPKGFNWWGD